MSEGLEASQLFLVLTRSPSYDPSLNILFHDRVHCLSDTQCRCLDIILGICISQITVPGIRKKCFEVRRRNLQCNAGNVKEQSQTAINLFLSFSSQVSRASETTTTGGGSCTVEALRFMLLKSYAGAGSSG